MFMIKSMLRKTLNGINDSIVYNLFLRKTKENFKIGTLFSVLLERKKRERKKVDDIFV